MSTFIRLTDYKSSDEKEQGFFKSENRYEAKQEDFAKIPSSPIGYWVNQTIVNIFDNGTNLDELAAPRKGVTTSDDNYFSKYWYEVFFNTIGFNRSSNSDFLSSKLKWAPLNRGGETRKWYGNLDSVINWENDGFEIKNFKDDKGKLRSRPQNINYHFRHGISWNYVSSGSFACRYVPSGIISNASGPMIYDFQNTNYLMAYMLSPIGKEIFKILCPTLMFEVGQVQKVPLDSSFDFNNELVNKLVEKNINISKEEWDSRETSWDFTRNELLKHKTDGKIETAYTSYCNYWREKFNTLHANEEELNKLFIDIYELQDELTPDIELKDITILKQEADIVDGELVFNADEIMKQFISYGVGVMFGRYSLDSEGLLIANIGQEVPSSTTFEIDDDNVIPVLEDDYFKDDIASRFVQFVKTTFGEENLRENIRFIENALGTTIRKYFVKGFYEDHIKRYKKRPIYWMVSSPKKGFNALIYMHRYQSDVFARVRNSYLTEYISKLEAHKETLHLTTTSETASDKDKKDADKQIKNIETKLKELIEFDRESMMSFSQNGIDIDLDDGVKVNYCKFQEILYPISGLCK